MNANPCPIEFKLNELRFAIPEQQLLNDLKEVAAALGSNTLSARDYDRLGKYNSRRFCRRWGSWNQALRQAGLEIKLCRNIPDYALFENMKIVWVSLGRQPGPTEMRGPLSKYSARTYRTRYGSWRNALVAFIEFINSAKPAVAATGEQGGSGAAMVKEEAIIYKHKTKRHPGERLKVEVLIRDGNKCRLCGATVTGDDIHFDHIIPWSKGGETTLENLQVLCKKHNLAKGDL